MEFCRFLRSLKFVVRSLGRFLGRGVKCQMSRRSKIKLLGYASVTYFPFIAHQHYHGVDSWRYLLRP